MKKTLRIILFAMLCTMALMPLSASAADSSQTVTPMEATNPVESGLSAETRKLITVILQSSKGTVSYPVSTKKQADKIVYQFCSFICNPNALSVSKSNVNDQKSYVIYASGVSSLKKRIKRVRKVDGYYYKVAKRLNYGKNRKTVRAIAKYIRNHLSYSSKKRNLYKNNRRGNCVVYAQMLYLLCRMNGIPAKIYYGATKTKAHCWNAVKIGGKWYWSDSCWYDSSHRSKYILSRHLWGTHKKYRRHLNGNYILNMY